MRHATSLSAPGWGHEIRATLALAGPLAAANLLQMLTYAVDVIFIARLGEAQLAASALAVSLFGLVLWALTGLTGAVAPLIAEAIGSRAPSLRSVRRSVRMALWLAVIAGVGGMGLCLLLDPVMQVSGQESQIRGLANEYNNVIIYSMVPMLLAAVLRNFVSALGRPIFGHRDHRGRHLRQCARQLCLHFRQSRRARDGARRRGGGHDPYLTVHTRRLCRGDPVRPAAAPLPRLWPVVVA